MIAADFLHANVHGLVLSGVSSPCRRACSARAFVPHFALPPALSPHVQTSCLEHGWPTAVAAFAGTLAARAAAPPGRSCRERKREANAEGKIEGRGTRVRAKPVCTWVGGGTRPRAAARRQQPQCLAVNGNTGCHIRSGAMGLAGAAS